MLLEYVMERDDNVTYRFSVLTRSKTYVVARNNIKNALANESKRAHSTNIASSQFSFIWDTSKKMFEDKPMTRSMRIAGLRPYLEEK